MADEVKELEEVEEKLLLWVKKHDKVMSENYKLKDEIEVWEEQSLKKLEESSLNLERIKELENCVKILEEQVGSEKDLFIKVKGLEHDLKEQEFCYKSAALRAKRYKSQLTIIKEALGIYSH